MDIVVLIGRILFSALFLSSAVGHLTQSTTMAQYAAPKGLPLPRSRSCCPGWSSSPAR
ncbi:hypothetical protein [Rhodococcus jostii]|uniref:DoxX family protein n=1 Tax=Rhodococcus jostii TaxID=132919 RepID=UPI0026D484CF